MYETVGSKCEFECSLLGSCFVLFCFWSEAGIEQNTTFLLGFNMVPSLTCREEPEAGDVRMWICQRNRPWQRLALEGGRGGVTWGGKPEHGVMEQSAPQIQPLRQAGGRKGRARGRGAG